MAALYTMQDRIIEQEANPGTQVIPALLEMLMSCCSNSLPQSASLSLP